MSQTLFCNFRRQWRERKLHLNVDKEQNLGKENKGKLYPGISTDISKLGTFFTGIACMFEGHYRQNRTFKSFFLFI